MTDLFRDGSMIVRRRPLAWALALAMTLALSASALAVDAEEEDKDEATVEVHEAEDQTEKPTLKDEEGGDGPSGLSTEEFIQDRDFKNVKLADEQIVHLRDLLESTPEGNPKRAEYMFALSEMYWDKSKYYEMEAFAKQNECYEAEDSGDQKAAKRCERSMERMLRESNRLRESAVDLYKEIARNYKDFKDLDKVYFYLGNNLQQMDQQEDAIRVFRQLLRDFPDTSYAPNVWISFGEYYFNNDDVDSALKAYRKASEYKNSEVYGYARYMTGWCHFNKDDKERALDTFLEVIDYAKKNPDEDNSKALIREARKDIVRTYSEVGNPNRAIPFLQDMADDDREVWLPLSERLAIHYSDKGNPNASTRIYRELIKLNKESVKTIDYQYEIVRNQTVAKTYGKESIQELVRLLKLVQLADEGHFKDTEQHDYPRTRQRVESLVRQWSTRYHREAQKTKNPDLYSMAYFLYKHYLETFSDSPEKYAMNFFYGELLYKLQQWEEAAQAYERVLEIDPEGDYTEDAVHAAVLAYFKVVDVSEEQRNLSEAKTAQIDAEDAEGDEEAEEAKTPEKMEIPDIHKKLLNACKRYIEHAPDGERIVDVKYTMARTYYDFNHFAESVDLFENIAYNHSHHRLAVIAANLHLDTLNLMQDFEGLHQAVLGYLEKEPIDDGPFMDDVYELNVQIRFKKCTIHDEEESWSAAAKCFVQFYRDFPHEEDYVDKALYNAALDFERMRDLGKAIKVRKFLLRAAPDSELAPETLFNIGGNYHALAVYSEAAKFYELFVANFPEHEDAEPALANASEFRYGLGHYDRAIKDYEKYLDLFGTKKPERAAVAYFQIARIHEIREEHDQAVEQYRRFLRRFEDEGDHDRILKSHAAIGMYYWDQGGDKNRKRALQEFEKTLDIYETVPEDKRGELSDGRDAAARAKFMIGEDVYEEMEAITIAASDEEELQERLKEKMEIAEKAQAIFEEVILYRRPDWAIAALYRIGAQYQNFAETIRDSPVPDRLTYDQKEIYKGLLEDQASTVETKAVAAYKQALDVALEQNWFNEYSKKAEIELAQLRPRDFRKPSELRAEPVYFKPGFMRSAFITDVHEEDRLQDLDGDDGGEDAEDMMDQPDVSEAPSDGRAAPPS